MIKILPLEHNDFEQIYNDMLAQFPKEELKSKEHFLELFGNPYYHFSTIYSGQDQIGYVTYIKNDYLWVDYFAIFKDFQSLGFGSKILTELLECNKKLKGCFFEVEFIDDQNINTLKRQNFYKRLGCTKLDFVYLFPNDYKELPLELLYKPLNSPISPTKQEIIGQIEKVFENVHFDVRSREDKLKKIRELNKI